MASPVEQFQIKPLIPLEAGGVDFSFTNSAMSMVIAISLIAVFLIGAIRSRAMVPGRWQSMAELSYEFVAGMLRENVGVEGRRYFPFIFSLFMFVLFGNLLGMVPYNFAYTSHLAVTFGLAIVVFIGVTIIGFARHGLGYFRMFFPHGAPIATAIVLVPIELISYLSRPLSLAVRLFANMTVGHIILKVMAGFTVSLGSMFFLFGAVPLAFNGAITVLELGIAILQAYVFAVLSCIYLHDAIHMH